jgi:HSP20 family protein
MPIRNPELWMWAEACRMLDRAEQMNRQFFRPAATAARRASWEPPVDIFETAGELRIIVALPGVAPERVEIRLEPDLLIVVGERRIPAELRGAAIHRLELPHGRFERQIRLPPLPWQIGRHAMIDGCLMLSLLKPQEGNRP